MIYLDSSALLKLLVDEPESASLERWLAERPSSARVSSGLVHAEVPRGLRRRRARRLLPAAVGLLDGLDLLPVTPTQLRAAGNVTMAELRTLDALHLAAASSLGDQLTWFVAYDRRLLGAARREGLPVAHPGMSGR